MDTSNAASAGSRRAVVVGAGEGQSHWVLSDLITVKVAAGQSGGTYTLVETTVGPGAGPPPHRHHKEDELFYVLDGEFEFILGQQIIKGPKGTCVHLPRGIPHTFKNVGATPARTLVFATPSGFEDFVAEVGHPCTDKTCAPPVTPADIDRLVAAMPRHGVEMLFTHKADAPGPEPAPGKPLWVLGQHVNLKLTSKETANSFCVCEVTVEPGQGVPAHSHRVEDEIFYVMEGTFEFLLLHADDKTGAHAVTAMPGSVVQVPRGTLHAFKNIGPVTGKLVDVHTPGGFEKFFEEAGCACTEGSSPPTEMPPPSHLKELFARHGMDSL